MRYLLVTLVCILSFGSIAYATNPLIFTSAQEGASPQSGYILQTDGTNSTWVANSSGAAFPFTPTSYGVSTSTTIGFLNGLFTSASTTLATTHLTGLTNSLLAVNGSEQIIASTTIGWNLLKGPASSLFAFDGSGNPVATTSIGSNYLHGQTNSMILAFDASGNPIATTTIGSNYLKVPASTILAGDGSGNVIATTSTWYSSGTTIFNANSGNVGIGTTTPGSLLSIGNSGGINLTPTATSTFSASANGINITNGCFAINDVCVGGSGISTPVSIANGGTNASSFTTSNSVVGYDGTRLVTAPLLTALTFPYASTTVISSTLSAYFATSGGNVGLGTTTPQFLLNPYATAAPQLALSSGAGVSQWTLRNSFGTLYFATTSPATHDATSTTPAITIDTNQNVGIGTTTPGTTFSIQGILNFTSSGISWLYNEIVGKDATNGWFGRISPTRSVALSTATTTTWTASTTGSGYSPFVTMPFAGTLRQIRCATDASFLGVNVQVNGSNATPSYFVASTTIGLIPFTAGNTFSAGQKILLNFGTTTTASALEISCTADVTESP